jgi:hypothetical protein
MAIPISNVTRRQVYAPSGSGGIGPYAFTFEILAATDIAVYKDDTLLTLTTHYTVTINANGTGSVTITTAGLALAPASPTQYAIVGNRTIARATDFTTGGDFFANTLNDELDQQTIFAQHNAEGVNRSLQAPQTDPTNIDMTLPRSSVRAGKLLAFDSSGNPEATETIGSNRGNWAAGVLYFKRDLVKDTSTSNIFQVNTEHTSVGAQPLTSNAEAAKYTLLVDAAAAGTSATAAAASASAAAASASTATTQATNAGTSATSAATSATTAQSAQTAAESARDQTLASFDSFDDRYLGAKTSDPTLDNDGNALLGGALYFNSVSGTMKVYTGSAWVAAYVSGTDFLALSGGTMTGTITFAGGQTFSGVQATLVSGTNIKTINGATVLGSGDLSIVGGAQGFVTQYQGLSAAPTMNSFSIALI